MKPVRLSRQRRLSTGICLLAGLILTGCASTPKYDADVAGPRPARAVKSEQPVHSSSDPDNDWGDAFTSPLEDLNLKRKYIPDILEKAIKKPYDLTGLDRCEDIAREVSQLDALLGADFDEPPPPKDTSTITQKGGRMANNAAVGAVRGAARSIIPFRGLVRQMTGAEAHEKELDTAIQAGKVRRAYLKGVGMNKNCAPPAAPSWFVPRVYVDSNDDGQAAKRDTTASQKRSSRKHP